MNVPLFLLVPPSTSLKAPEDLLLSNSFKWGYSCSPPKCRIARTLFPRMLEEKQKWSIKERRHSSSLRYQNIYPFSNHWELTWKLEVWNWQVIRKRFINMELYNTPPQTLSAHRTYQAPWVLQESHARKRFTWDDALTSEVRYLNKCGRFDLPSVYIN